MEINYKDNYDNFFNLKIKPILKKYNEINVDLIFVLIVLSFFIYYIISIMEKIHNSDFIVYICIFIPISFSLICMFFSISIIRPDGEFGLFLEVLTELYGDEISENKIKSKDVFDCDFLLKNKDLVYYDKFLTKNKNINIYPVFNNEKALLDKNDENTLFDGLLIKIPLPSGLTDDFVSFKRKKFNLFNNFSFNKKSKYFDTYIPNKKLARIYELHTDSSQNANSLLSAFTNLIMKYPGKVFLSVEDGFLNVGLNYTRLDGVLYNYIYKKDLKFFIEAMSIIEKINNEGIL